MNFLLFNPVTAVKRVLSKKLELYLEANKFPPSGDEPPAQTKNGMFKFLELHQTKLSHFHKNLDSLFLCRLEMRHPFSQIFPYL
jgi:hypothetical protein